MGIARSVLCITISVRIGGTMFLPPFLIATTRLSSWIRLLHCTPSMHFMSTENSQKPGRRECRGLKVPGLGTYGVPESTKCSAPLIKGKASLAQNLLIIEVPLTKEGGRKGAILDRCSSGCESHRRGCSVATKR